MTGLFACKVGRWRAVLAIGVAVACSQGADAIAQTDWPEFRGPWHNGHASAPGDTTPRGLPLQWSETENVAWKTPIPHHGWSTPVIMDGQVWLTAATEEGHDFFIICVDAATGVIRLNRKVFHEDNPEPLGNNINTYASPSAVLEPGRVYIHFGSYGTACLDAATGDAIWERRDLPCRHYRGPGSSPVVFENLLILTFDGVDQQYTTALDKQTGETVWKTDRSTEWDDLDSNGKPKRDGDYRKAFCTPLVADANGAPQLLSLGAEAMFAYDPRTGKEIWTAEHGGHSASARPLFGDGLALLTTGHGKSEMWAVRLDGQGNVTDTHVAWKVDGRAIPKQPSPILADGLIFLVSNDGVAACLEAATGEEVWQDRIGGNFMASLVYADGRLYISDMQGETTVFKPGREFEVLATNRLDEGCLASPAVSGRALFLRTKTHLYRIETR
ncbi:MAG: PQQ-like beta-propeller repeat protein [bacterium]|nr:PQQ-like beta-propeller repeat protein [bacterium]